MIIKLQSLFILVIFLLFLASCRPQIQIKKPSVANDAQIEDVQTTYTPNWKSLSKHDTPSWFLDAKFGIYCHWGPYSVPAFKNEWYSHWMYTNENNPEYKRGQEFYDHHIKTYGSLQEFGYKDFIPRFKAEKFDAAEWAELFKSSGAKFAGPVSEHADGFAMWDSDLTNWDAKDRGPKRDIMGELALEIRKRGMKFISTYHRHWLLGWYPTWDESTDAFKPEYSGLYGPKLKKGDFQYPFSTKEIDEGTKRYYPLADTAFNEEWLLRLKEIIDKYEPDMVWFDNKMDVIGEAYRKEFLSYYYNQAAKRKQEVVATYKFYDFAEGTAVLDLERSRMTEKKDFPWLTDDSIDWESWSHISTPRYKSVNRLIDFLVDVVSKNGCVLLNITPRANGEIPEPVKERLLKIGEWLNVNGEAVYGTRTWEIYGEGPQKITEGHLSENENPEATAQDLRYTTKGDTLYAIVLDWLGKKAVFPALCKNSTLYSKTVSFVSLLGHEEELEFERTDKGLEVRLPLEKTV